MKKSKTSNEEYLTFNDWFNKHEHQAKDWTIVARKTLKKGNREEDLATISCLLKADKHSLNKFFKRKSWEINNEFGIPQKYYKPHYGEKYDDETTIKRENIIYKPFIFRRYFNGYIPGYYQIIEHFLLYYNCFWDKNKQEYLALEASGKLKTVVKFIENEIGTIVIVDNHYLRDYLAVKGMLLARFHDFRRRIDEKFLTSASDKGNKKAEINSENLSFDLILFEDIMLNNGNTCSRLLGKDVLYGYERPKDHSFDLEKDENDFLKFIVDRNNEGKEVLSTCNPDVLSSYFDDNGNKHYLTPIYFKKEVLNKYYAEPKKYRVSETMVSFLDFWSIDIDLTGENLVQVYLGDIGRSLQIEEQLHWRQYNTFPKGTISEHRFKRDFLAQFATPTVEEAPIFHLKIEFENLQNKFQELYQLELFKNLAPNDQHLYQTLHIPNTEEWKELDEQLLAIAKITTDSFNNKSLVKLTSKKIGETGVNGKQIKGLLALFYEFLVINIEDENLVNEIIEPFNVVQALRSSSVAHRKSKSLDKALNKYSLENVSNDIKFKIIMINLTIAFQKIISNIK